MGWFNFLFLKIMSLCVHVGVYVCVCVHARECTCECRCLQRPEGLSFGAGVTGGCELTVVSQMAEDAPAPSYLIFWLICT